MNVASPTGIHSIGLAEKELLIVSTSEAERQQVASKYAENSKTGSTRKSRKAHDQVSPSRHTEIQNAPSHMSQSAPSIPRLRRPHTSAGPRDKLGNLSGVPYTLPRNFFGPETGRGPPSPVFWKRRKDSVQKPLNDSASMLTLLRSRISVNSTCSSFDTDSDAVREWEQELARIEIRSRRSSELIGFPWKRRRSATVLPEKYIT